MILNLPSSDTGKLTLFWMNLRQVSTAAADELGTLMKGAEHGLTVTIEPLEHEKSREQEGYYRKWCREFGHYCGMTPDEMHDELLCAAFGSQEVPTKFGPRRRPIKRSGRLKVDEYSHLIDTLIRVGAEMGFQVPPAQK